MLVDGVICDQSEAGRFVKTTWLPATANESVKHSAFVALNGDDANDIWLGKADGTLALLVNETPVDRAVRLSSPFGHGDLNRLLLRS
ncbi:MAG: hypothetical protein GVY16_09410 [Planctomycetes bacterium]|nr:hypothetical protein [Planctomycetota bacterium]